MSRIVAEYVCPEHGRFDRTLERTVAGDAPDDCPCPDCGIVSPWTISAPLHRVAVTAARGGWQKPERKTYLDTRELGEGMDIQEWREKRAAIREEQRKREVMELVRTS